MEGYLPEALPALCCFCCLSDARSTLRRAGGAVHVSRPAARRTCSQSLLRIRGSQRATSRRSAFHKDVQTDLKKRSLLVQRQHDGGTFFRTLGCFGSYGEQMVSRLSGTTAMIFPLRCLWSAFRRGAWRDAAPPERLFSVFSSIETSRLADLNNLPAEIKYNTRHRVFVVWKPQPGDCCSANHG